MSGIESVFGETPIDPSGLIPNIQPLNRATLSNAEAENISTVVEKYLIGDVPTAENAPFDFSWLLQLHKEMFSRTWSWAGVLRKTELTIGVPATQVETGLYDLTQSMAYWQSCNPIELVARLHHRLVQIHPFENGNGRWSRMAANIRQLMTTGTMTQWPDQLLGVVSPIRGEYIAALKQADGGNLSVLTKLHEAYSVERTEA